MKEVLVFLVILEFLVDHSFCGSIKGSTRTARSIESALDEFTYYEIVKPAIYHRSRRRASTALKEGQIENFTLEIEAYNRTFHLSLQQNRDLLGKSYLVKYFDEDGLERIYHPENHTQSHCYYHGKMRGEPEAMVALSTCSGIRGQISLPSEVFYLEPSLQHSQGVHYMFSESHRIPTNHKCGYDEDLDDFSILENKNFLQHSKSHQNREKRSLHWPYDTNDKTRIVELYIANDYRQYERYNHDITTVIERTKGIVNIVSSLYRPLNIYVALVGMEIWTRGDLIDVVDNAAATMNNFLEYRRTKISPKHKNDNAQLITGREFKDGVVGKAVKNTICSWQYSGGVDMDHSELLGPVATTVAHEMGHNFGMQHDSQICDCSDDKCIMAASSSGKNPTKWSSCSKEQLADAFHQGLDYCLHNLPDELYDGPVCGNGFLEQGEECDCGRPEDCDNLCCNATTCTLMPNATCATGACCDLNSCQVKKATTECRRSQGECDLAEFCDGTSEFCPSDVHIQNGNPCQNNKAYCYMGQCNSHDSQCKLLWGESGQMAHKLCFEHFNIMGLANGHCGFNWVDKSFKACKPEDTLCGMVHCTHRMERLRFWKEALAYTMPEAWVMVNNTRQECKGAILDVGLSMRDPGLSPQGAKCGDNKMCVNQQCTAINNLDRPQCPSCHGNGVCNSIGQCHCDVGFMPPFCNEPGHGGSIHSGPIKYMNTNTSLIVALVLLFLVILPALIISFLCFYRYRPKFKKLWNGRPYIKYDFLHRAKRSEPNTTPTHKRTESRPQSRQQQPLQQVASVPISPVESTTSSGGPDRSKRQSFRGMEISNPALQFCTKTSQSLENMTDIGTGEHGSRPLSQIDETGEPRRFMSFNHGCNASGTYNTNQWGAPSSHGNGPSVSASSGYYQNTPSTPGTDDGLTSPKSRPERPPPTYMEKLKPQERDMSPPTPPPPPLKPRNSFTGHESTPPRGTPYYGNVENGPKYQNVPEEPPPVYTNVEEEQNLPSPISPPPMDTPLGQVGQYSKNIHDIRRNFENGALPLENKNGPLQTSTKKRPERPNTKPGNNKNRRSLMDGMPIGQPQRPPPIKRSQTTAGGPKPTINGPARPGMARSQSTTTAREKPANGRKPAISPKPSTLLSKSQPRPMLSVNGHLPQNPEDSNC